MLGSLPHSRDTTVDRISGCVGRDKRGETNLYKYHQHTAIIAEWMRGPKFFSAVVTNCFHQTGLKDVRVCRMVGEVKTADEKDAVGATVEEP